MLSPRQQHCLDLLLAGHSKSSAARAMNANASTVCRWTQRQDFKDAFHLATAERRRLLHTVMDAAAPKALATMIRLATDRSTPPAVQLKACLSILEQAGVFERQEVAQTENKALKIRADQLARLGRVFAHPVSASPAPLILVPLKSKSDG